MSDVQRAIDTLATLACKKKQKEIGCNCPPCAARMTLFGRNLAVGQQERLRSGEVLEFVP
jgi:hypothetical protein